MNDEKILLLSRQCAQLAGHVAYLEMFLPIVTRHVKPPRSAVEASAAIYADKMGSLSAGLSPDLLPEFQAGFQAAAQTVREIAEALPAPG